MSQIKNERKVHERKTYLTHHGKMCVNRAILSFVTIRYSKLNATAWVWSTQRQAEESTLQCNVTKCLRFTCHKTGSILLKILCVS